MSEGGTMSDDTETPALSESGLAEFERLIEAFKKRMAREAEDIISGLYVDLPRYVESDAWSNYREALRNQLAGWAQHAAVTETDSWGVSIRARIAREHLDALKDARLADVERERDEWRDRYERLQRSPYR